MFEDDLPLALRGNLRIVSHNDERCPSIVKLMEEVNDDPFTVAEDDMEDENAPI